MQRAGCVSGASLLVSRERDPVDHARVCTALQGVDTYNCLRGINVPALDGRTFEQLRLVRTCGDLPSETSAWCYRWFGRTLAVLTDGAFRMQGCAQLGGRGCRRPVRTRGAPARGSPSGRSPRPPAPATVALGDCHRRERHALWPPTAGSALPEGSPNASPSAMIWLTSRVSWLEVG